MARVKRGVASRQYRKKVLKAAKGFYGRSKNCYRVATQKVDKAGQYSYRDRKVRRREFRSLWIKRINAAVRLCNLKYSVFMNLLKRNDVNINRKMLASMAVHNPQALNDLIGQVAKSHSSELSRNAS